MWTDASSTGYDEKTDNLKITRITQGLGWGGGQSEKNLHINVLELMKVSIAIEDFKPSNIIISSLHKQVDHQIRNNKI